MATSDTEFFSGINATEEDEEEYKKTWKLPQHNELRFEVRADLAQRRVCLLPSPALLPASRRLTCHAHRRWRRQRL